jgi:hypothetical protein
MCVTLTYPKFYFLPTVCVLVQNPLNQSPSGLSFSRNFPRFRLIALFTRTRHWSSSPLLRASWMHFTHYLCKGPYVSFIYMGTLLLNKYPGCYGTARLIGANGRIHKSTYAIGSSPGPDDWLCISVKMRLNSFLISPMFTLLGSPHTITLWAMYKLLINLLSCQSIPVPFRADSHIPCRSHAVPLPF